jgi:integrase
MPKLKSGQAPKIKRHKASGRAVVVLSGQHVYLGAWPADMPDPPDDVRNRHDRVVGEWLARGRRSPAVTAVTSSVTDISVEEVVLAYWRFAEVYYGFGRGRGDEACIRCALRVLRESYGKTRAASFGPLALKACRQRMIDKLWSRNYVNAQVDRIRQMFKWAAGEQLVSGTVYLELKMVAGLRRGKTSARETKRIRPANPDHVSAALPFMPTAVQGLVKFQQLTGCRPAEACMLRVIDLDMSNPSCWVYRPGSDSGEHGEHKTAHHGHDRAILIGPRAQEVIRPYIDDKGDPVSYLFCPKDATAERNEKVRARRTSPARRKCRQKSKPRRAPGDRYTVRAFARAIARACRRAQVPEWGPNRLRHSRATELRPYGLDVVKTVLGHSKVETSQVYAEKDFATAMELVAKIG